MSLRSAYRHIVLDKKKGPVIEGTLYQVVHLIEERLSHGWSPEELQFQHPDLSLGQIHSALAYYEDHREELNLEIEQSVVEYDRLRAASRPSPIAEKLRAKGLLK